jgi:SSS family solute:Na+ symporter
VVVSLLVLVVLVLPWGYPVGCFTGLLGAWLSAVFLIPKVSHLGHKYNFLLFHKYSITFTILGGFVSGHNFGNRICWFYKFSGFGWSQISIGYNRGLKLTNCIIVMGLIAVIYTIGD